MQYWSHLKLQFLGDVWKPLKRSGCVSQVWLEAQWEHLALASYLLEVMEWEVGRDCKVALLEVNMFFLVAEEAKSAAKSPIILLREQAEPIASHHWRIISYQVIREGTERALQ